MGNSISLPVAQGTDTSVEQPQGGRGFEPRLGFSQGNDWVSAREDE